MEVGLSAPKLAAPLPLRAVEPPTGLITLQREYSPNHHSYLSVVNANNGAGDISRKVAHQV